jgi:hypothetical protein
MARPVQRLRSRALALARVLTLLGAGLALSSLVLLSAARARAAEVLLGLGAQLMRLPDARYANGVQTLSLNGLALLVQSGASARAPAELVRQFHAACRQGAPLADHGPLPAAAAQAPESPWLERWLDEALVEASDGGTAVACIVAGERPHTVRALIEQTARFFASGDLSELGRLRYAWVVPDERGGSAFLTLWSEGSLALLDRFPPDRDAPGQDLPDVARVPGSRRLLSASLETSALAVYQHERAELEGLSQAYRAVLTRAGYVAVHTPPPVGGVLAQVYSRAGRAVLLGVQQGDAGASFVTLLARP